MVECAYNHVCIYVENWDEAVSFYTEVFDMEHAPSPEEWEGKVAWLQFGGQEEQQLHVCDYRGRDLEPHKRMHFALVVDDFETVYQRAKEHEYSDEATMDVKIFPNGVISCYINDPTGNKLEFVYPHADHISDEIVEEAEYWELTSRTGGDAGENLPSNVYQFIED